MVNLLIGGLRGKLITVPIYAIFYSLITAGVFCFFWVVLLSNTVTFLVAWKYSYYLVLAVNLWRKVIWVFLARLTVGWYVSWLMNVTLNDALEGILKFGILNRYNIGSMDPEVFKALLEQERQKQRISDIVMKHLLGKYK